MSEDPDRDLVLRCQTVGSEGFEAAFKELYRGYKDRVYSLAYRITGNQNDALDAAQEAFVLVYQRIHTFAFESKFSSWLYRLVVNASIDHLRRQKSRRSHTEIPLDHESPDSLGLEDESLPGPREAAERHELGDQVHTAIQRLSPKLRAITVLRYQNHLSYEELAETLQISLGTVKSRLARAHVALATILGPVLDSPTPGADSSSRSSIPSSPSSAPRSDTDRIP